MKTDLFISLEGTEGAGKSTALQFIQHYFAEKNKSIVLTREPGGTDIAEQIRHILLHANNAEKMRAETELLLMFAARAQHITEVILPALNANKIVVSDRFVDASYAYQGGGRGIDKNKIMLLDKMVVGNVYPKLTILLDISAEAGMQRAEKRGAEKDRIEKERMDFFVRVRNAYLERAKAEPQRIKIVDANQSLDNVQQQLKIILDEFIQRF